jgi:hypothetical protein
MNIIKNFINQSKLYGKLLSTQEIEIKLNILVKEKNLKPNLLKKFILNNINNNNIKNVLKSLINIKIMSYENLNGLQEINNFDKLTKTLFKEKMLKKLNINLFEIIEKVFELELFVKTINNEKAFDKSIFLLNDIRINFKDLKIKELINILKNIKTHGEFKEKLIIHILKELQNQEVEITLEEIKVLLISIFKIEIGDKIYTNSSKVWREYYHLLTNKKVNKKINVDIKIIKKVALELYENNKKINNKIIELHNIYMKNFQNKVDKLTPKEKQNLMEVIDKKEFELKKNEISNMSSEKTNYQYIEIEYLNSIFSLYENENTKLNINKYQELEVDMYDIGYNIDSIKKTSILELKLMKYEIMSVNSDNYYLKEKELSKIKTKRFINLICEYYHKLPGDEKIINEVIKLFIEKGNNNEYYNFLKEFEEKVLETQITYKNKKITIKEMFILNLENKIKNKRNNINKSLIKKFLKDNDICDNKIIYDFLIIKGNFAKNQSEQELSNVMFDNTNVKKRVIISKNKRKIK